MKMNLKCSKEDSHLIFNVLKRVEELKLGFDTLMVFEDLAYTHCNIISLDFNALLSATPGNFQYEIVRIMNCIDKRRGKFKDGFVPVYAAKEKVI